MGEKFKMIRCKSPDDILIVETREDAEGISMSFKNPCHPHRILVKAEYVRSVQEAVEAETERCAKMAEDYNGDGMLGEREAQLGNAFRTKSDIAAAIRRKP